MLEDLISSGSEVSLSTSVMAQMEAFSHSTIQTFTKEEVSTTSLPRLSPPDVGQNIFKDVDVTDDTSSLLNETTLQHHPSGGPEDDEGKLQQGGGEDEKDGEDGEDGQDGEDHAI